jgi:hypothetical protein
MKKKQIPWNKNKQFCPHGHDTFVVGRNPANGSCKECDRIRGRKRYVPVKVDKRFTRFCPRGHDKDIVGRVSDGNCKECKRINTKTWREQHPKKAKEVERTNNAKRRENGKIKNWYLQRTYEITLEEYNDILKKQNYRCAICGISLKKYKKSFHVDHNHETNKIRGLLCYSCNTLLGYAKDDIRILKKAILFLMEE